ncbi:amidase [Pararhizobium sp. DWP3-4]|uniref:amidase n=1 Tax=Pararhizobium sp. DWP3-4 TaxID=2804565 RepID=UPI003CFA525D
MEESLAYKTLLEVSEKIRTGEVSPTALTEHLLDRIAMENPKYYCYETITADHARNQAEKAERDLREGTWLGPLHGVPIAVKDLYETSFAPTKGGTRIYDASAMKDSATVVTRLESAGAVILGKLQMTEAAYTNHHPSVVAPVNPVDAEYWVGTSSTGPGVATAAGLCFASLGSDTGGSIRFPSATCGLTGLKPTWGRVSRHGVLPMASSLDHVGPMCRSAADAAAMLGVIAGRDPHDLTTSMQSVPNYMEFISRDTAALKIGIDRSYTREGLDPQVIAALDEAEHTFVELGASIVEISMPDYRPLTTSWMSLCSVELAIAHSDTYPIQKAIYGPELAAFLDFGRTRSGLDVGKIIHERFLYSCGLAAGLENVDMLLIPTMPMTTPSLVEMSNLGKMPEVLTELLRFTAPFNFSGSPTVTLPNGVDSNGMPLSMQLVGKHFREEVILKAAHLFQRHTDWHALRRTIPSGHRLY